MRRAFHESSRRQEFCDYGPRRGYSSEGSVSSSQNIATVDVIGDAARSRREWRHTSMSDADVSAEGLVGAPARRVYALIADFREHHPKFLPTNCRDFEIEQGGVGEGKIFTVTATAG